MMKRIISLCLVCALLASLVLTVSAEKATVTANYYKVDMSYRSQNDDLYTIDVEVMIYPSKNELYIKGDDLAFLAEYDYNLSDSSCAFSSEERGHLVFFEFGADSMLVYQSGQPMSYRLPYEVEFIDGVAWIPMDFGMTILNMYYYIDENGASCCAPYETVMSVAHRIIQGELSFDYARDIGYSDSAMLGLETGAFLVNLFNGVIHMEGRCWGTLVTSVFGNKDLYDGMMAEKVCELFIMPAKGEISESVLGIYKFPENLQKTGAGVEAHYGIVNKYLNEVNELKANCNTKIFNNIDEVNKEVSKITGKSSLSYVIKDHKVNLEEEVVAGIGFAISVGATTMQFKNRNEIAVDALKRYGKLSDSNVASTVSRYAKTASVDSDLGAAVLREAQDQIDNYLIGKAVNLGPGALIVVGWDVASHVFPYLKNSLDSAEYFACAQQAVVMQDDSYWILNEDFNKALSSKKLKEGSLEDAAVDCYTYLKFSLIARDFAIESIRSAHKIDEKTKESIVARLEEKRDDIAYMISPVSIIEKGSGSKVINENGIYGLLLPSESAEYCRNLDDSPAIKAIEGGVGTLIASCQQETEPVKEVLITEQEAIEMVRKAFGKYTMGLTETTLKDLYTYECLGLYDAYIIDLEAEGFFDGTADYDTEYCYVIELYTAGTKDATFCVPADGTGVYLGDVFEDGYGFIDSLELNSLSISDVLELFDSYNNILLGLLAEQYEQSTGTGETVSPDTQSPSETW